MRRGALALLLGVGCAPPAAVAVRTVPPGPAPAAAFVERALHERGLRFGTDGTVRALYRYLSERHTAVASGQARPGDVVFFALEAGCGTHVGLVEAVEPGGRITFREQRGGEVRRSYAMPALPAARRDADGRVLNSFLRPRRREDPPGLHYFSGELLCAVVRVGR